jgi:hypothetical protein
MRNSKIQGALRSVPSITKDGGECKGYELRTEWRNVHVGFFNGSRLRKWNVSPPLHSRFMAVLA